MIQSKDEAFKVIECKKTINIKRLVAGFKPSLKVGGLIYFVLNAHSACKIFCVAL